MNSRRFFSKSLQIVEIIYLLLVVLSVYFLVASRTDEARTVWEVLHPAFIPTLFVALSFLVAILFSKEKVAYKLLFIVIVSVLLHSFFVIVFPAGDSSGQQMVLGRTRLVFDGVIPSELPSSLSVVNNPIYELLRGKHFFSAITVVFARMFSLDIFWVHLFFIPVFWGAFTPIAAFLTTKALGGDDNVSALAGLLISAFPYATYFGAISVPNSLGFLFFFYSLFFMMKYLSSSDFKTIFLLLTFSFFSFLAHFLAGIVSFSLLILAVALKAYASEKKPSSKTTKLSLVISLVASVSILPMSLIYLRLFRPGTETAFTLEKLSELPINEIAGLLSLGRVIYFFDPKTILLFIVGPLIAILSMIYLFYRLKKNPDAQFRTHVFFLASAFLVVVIVYRILMLFMSGLPFNEERLWVFRDIIIAPFVAIAICSAISTLKSFLKSASASSIPTEFSRGLSKSNVLRISILLVTLNILIPAILGGWITFSLSASYPQVAPLQVTSYELDAVRIIDESTVEKYVVICDIWTVYAGEVIVGILNPRAYYFGEYDPRGNDLFGKMRNAPSPEVMLEAMNETGTNTTVAYFVINEARLGTVEFNNVLIRVNQNSQLTPFYVSDNGKLYVFSYEKE